MMLKHVLMFRLKPEGGGADKVTNLKRLKEGLESLKEKIPELRALEVGQNISQSPASYDLFLYTEFEDLEALERYRVHPEHQKVVELVQEICEDRRVVDYWA